MESWMRSFRLLMVGLVLLLPAQMPAHAQSVSLKDLVGTWVGGPTGGWSRALKFRGQFYDEAQRAAVAARRADIDAGRVTESAVISAFADSMRKLFLDSVLKAVPDTLIVWPDTTFSAKKLVIWPGDTTTKDSFRLAGDTLSWEAPHYVLELQQATRPVSYTLKISGDTLFLRETGPLGNGELFYRRVDRTPKP